MKKKTPNLIGISGYIGSGKDTFAKAINYHCTGGATQYSDVVGFTEHYADGMGMYPWEEKKFAEKLKLVVSMFTGITRADLERQEIKDSFLGPEWDKLILAELGNGGWGMGTRSRVFEKDPKRMRVRDMLQLLGTNAMRDVIHPDIHVNGLFADYLEECKWIITDVRFPNEAEAIINRGGVIVRIDRPEGNLEDSSQTKPVKHISETALDDWKFDCYIYNTGTLEELFETAELFCEDFNLI